MWFVYLCSMTSLTYLLQHKHTLQTVCLLVLLELLSTHVDRQVVDITFTVCLFVCVCMVTDFSAEDKASGVIFWMAVHQRPRQGISHFLWTLLLQKPKIGWIGQHALVVMWCYQAFVTHMPIKFVQRMEYTSVPEDGRTCCINQFQSID